MRMRSPHSGRLIHTIRACARVHAGAPARPGPATDGNDAAWPWRYGPAVTAAQHRPVACPHCGLALPRHLRRAGWLKPAGFWHFLQASRARSMGDRDSSKKAAAPGVRCGCCPNPLIYSQFMGRTGHRACIIGQFASSFRNPIGQLVSYPACVFLLLS